MAVQWIAVSEVQAQSTAKSTIGSEDTPVTLSPFVVDVERDSGYGATSTMAGTRLNTPIAELGAAISIYTKTLLDDLGATDSSDLLIYATGMEASGSSGNFAGASNDINAESVVGNAGRVNPQETSRTRGLASPNYSRGLFPTLISVDAYNTERVTVSRGPNAILFGVGSPAGVVDTTLLRPNLNRNQSKVEFRVGNNSSLRGVLDHNQVIIQKKLGFRFALLGDNEEYNQRPAFQEKRRLYGAATYEPFRKTAIRANFETGHTRANRPITVLPFNSTEMWADAGRTPYDWTYYDDPARNPMAASINAGVASQIGFFINQGTIQNQMLVVHNNPTDPSPAFGFRSEIPSTSANAANSIKNQVFNPVFNRDRASDIIRYLGSMNIYELPAAYWTGDKVLPGQLEGMVPAGIKQQGFTDFSAFDFKNRMIDESSIQGDSFHAFNISAEQRAWDDKIGIELAYDTQRVDVRGKNSFVSSTGSNHIRIDPNVTLPTGEPNPNLGRPYMLASQVNYSNNFKESNNLRATAYLNYDFSEHRGSLIRWLGRHTLTGLYEESANETLAYNHSFAFDGAAARDRAAQVNHAGRGSRRVVYLGPSLVGNTNPLQLEAVRIPALTAGPLPDIPYFVRAGNATDPGSLVYAPASLVEINTGGSAVREVIKSQAAVLQSHWLDDHLVTLVGWRRDEDYFLRNTINFVPNPADSNDPGKVQYGFGDFTFPETPPFNVAGEVTSYSGVLRWPRGIVRLPRGTDLSVFYNTSRNFTPAGGRINGYGEKLGSPEGETKEFGFNLMALKEKLTLRVNWFKTSVKGQSYNPSVILNASQEAIVHAAAFWYTEGLLNPHLMNKGIADAELLYSVLPSNYRDLYGWKVVDEGPNQSVIFNSSLPGRTDTTDYTARGTELELIFNPSRSWRILANVAKQETVKSNSLPYLKDLIARMTPVWNQLRGRPRATYPAGWQEGDPLPSNVQTFGAWLDANVYSPFATALATEGSASAEQRKWRANLVTSYSFDRSGWVGGKLKGFSIGCAIRWQDKVGIGYPTTRRSDGSVDIDLKNPYYAPDEWNVDAFASYERKLFRDRVRWKIQLNVRNLIGDDSPIAIGVQPWGQISTVRLAPERRWYVTQSLAF